MKKYTYLITIILASVVSNSNGMDLDWDNIMKRIDQGMININKPIDNYGMTLLHHIAMNGHTEIAQKLINRGAHINVKGFKSITPLHVAIIENNMKMVQWFIDHDANINAQDHDNYTPLHLAASKGFLNIVQYLVSRGANANSITTEGITPLKLAHDNHHKEIAEFLRKFTLNSQPKEPINTEKK